ncbi:hypothetical protein [Thiofilum flexile]|uniref:hypothetical protein n=1 Tax=Thiofilum flexile TaxID=125627 RepID=UPI0003638DFC|nr:hypothetical protein [Thiofilum flexile]
MHFDNNVQTIRLNISDDQALQIRERELQRSGVFKVNVSRIHSALIEIEIISRPIIDVTPKHLN